MNIFGTDLMRRPGMWGGLPPMANAFPQGGSQIYSGANPEMRTADMMGPSPIIPQERMPEDTQGPQRKPALPAAPIGQQPLQRNAMTRTLQRRGPAFGGLPPMGAL